MASSNPNAITCLQRLEILDIQDGIYIRTRSGWLYLAVVLDLFARKVVGWAMAPEMQATLVCQALQLAIVQRRPAPGLIVHSDRGSQYASAAHQALLARHGLVGRMSRKGVVLAYQKAAALVDKWFFVSACDADQFGCSTRIRIKSSLARPYI